MPESKVRKAAADKKKAADRTQLAQQRSDRDRTVAAPGSRQWVPPTFITVGLLGVLCRVVRRLRRAGGVRLRARQHR